MKQIAGLIIIISSHSDLFAQNKSIGVESGFISSINSDFRRVDFKNRRNTYYSGLNLNFHINQRLTFLTGLHYMRQGYRDTTCYIFERGERNVLTGKIDYLSVPLSLIFNLGKSKNFLITSGIMIAYNIKAVQDYPEPIGGCAIYYIKDISEFTARAGISSILGTGYRIFSNEKWQINTMVKYYQGLTNAAAKTKYNLKWNRRYSSALITLTMNYNI